MVAKSATPAGNMGKKERAPLLQDEGLEAGWAQVKTRTMVDHAVDSILAAASRGLILPGDRVSEPDLVTRLGMSRAPIREALRILESQGIVTSEPYKGMRLMDVSPQRLGHIIDVRIPLETLACRRAIEQKCNGVREINCLNQSVDELTLMMQRKDVYGFASADTHFHRVLCSFANNPVLNNLWESIARQLTVIFGLSTMGKSMASIVEEHQRLAAAFAEGDIDKMAQEIELHVRVQSLDMDYEKIIAERRKQLNSINQHDAFLEP